MTVASHVQTLTWMKEEGATYKTPQAIVAGDAVAGTLKIEPSMSSSPLPPAKGTASPQGSIKGNRGGKWSLEEQFAVGALGVAPNYGPALKAAFGTETINPGVAVTYSLTDGVTHGIHIHSLQLEQYTGDTLYEVALGAMVESLKIEISDGVAGKITFAGSFAEYGYLYPGAEVLGVEAEGSTEIILESGDARLVGVGALIKFGAKDNSGAGYRVTDKDEETDLITISPAIAAGDDLAADDALTPVVPSHTLTVDTPCGGTENGLSIDGVDVDMLNGTIELATGLVPREGQATQPSAIGVKRVGQRAPKLSFAFEHLEENAALVGGAWDLVAAAIIMRAGPDTAGKRGIMTCPAAEFEVSSPDIPDGEIAMSNLTGLAKQYASAADEMTLALT